MKRSNTQNILKYFIFLFLPLFVSGCVTFPADSSSEVENTEESKSSDEQITHIVEFDSNGGPPVASQLVKHGEKVVKPDITREGYEVEGWYIDNEKWVFNGYAVTYDMTLIAEWTKVGITEEDIDDLVKEIVMTTPLVINKTTGETIHGNEFRKNNNLTDPKFIPVLKDSDDLILLTNGIYSYEEEEADLYVEGFYEIEWSYFGENDEESSFATFEFVEETTGLLKAIPNYPTYSKEHGDSVPEPINGRLIATIKINNFAAVTEFDLILNPMELIKYYNLVDARNVPESTPMTLRGYVTGLYPSYNNATISDGEYGFGLFKVQDFEDILEIGTLIEVVGDYSNYNGLSQIQWIKRIKQLDPKDYPEIKKPIVKEVTADMLFAQSDAYVPQGPLGLYDNATAKINTPFKFKEMRDRDEKLVTDIASIDVQQNTYYHVILTTKTSADQEFDVKLVINHNIGQAQRELFRDFFKDVGENEFTYEGRLGAFLNITLEPYSFDAIKLAP